MINNVCFICSQKSYIKLLLGFKQGYILCKILWPGGGEWCRGNKMKNEAVGNKMKKKEKGERKKKKRKRGSMIFFVNIMHTSVDHCILT